MTADRYTKFILTVLALELAWIALNTASAPLAAQQAAATPVVIRGIEMPASRDSLPVTLVGSTSAVRFTTDRPLRIVADRPLVVETGDRPLAVRAIREAPAERPGE